VCHRIVRGHLAGAADQADGHFPLALLPGVMIAKDNQRLRIAGIHPQCVKQHVGGSLVFSGFHEHHRQFATGTLV